MNIISGIDCTGKSEFFFLKYLQLMLMFDSRLGQEPPGTTEEQIWYAKRLYESAFHPDTGDKQNVIGRMSFQVPGGMILTGAMLTFYK